MPVIFELEDDSPAHVRKAMRKLLEKERVRYREYGSQLKDEYELTDEQKAELDRRMKLPDSELISMEESFKRMEARVSV